MNEDINDVGGCPVQVGDYLVQAFNKGRCAALKFAKVLRVNEEKGTLYVDGISKKEYGDQKWEFASKPYSLRFSDRSMVINERQLPAVVNRMFAEKYK